MTDAKYEINFYLEVNFVSIMNTDSNYTLVSDLVVGSVGVDYSKASSDLIGKQRHRRYPLEFKLMIVEEAKRSSNGTVSRIHGIDTKCIRDWRRDEYKIRAALETGQVRFRLEGGGRKAESFNVLNAGNIQ